MKPTIDIETIAARIHQFYCELAIEESWENDFAMTYDELPEFMKEDNREAARRIGDVLGLAGLILVPREAGQAWENKEQATILDAIAQNLEILAEGEHDGWADARQRHGWRIGPEKNIEAREHPLLMPYEELSEKEKNKDRDSVRNYVPIIAGTAFLITTQQREHDPSA